MSYYPVFVVSLVAFVLTISSGDVKNKILKLLKFPIFYLGVFFVAYICIQIENPWAEFSQFDGFSKLTFLNFCPYLPSGVIVFNDTTEIVYQTIIQSMLVVFVASAVYLNINSQSDVVFFAVAISMSAFLCACLGIVSSQFFPNTIYIWGIRDFNESLPFGSFPYKNQCAAYLLLGLACCLGLCSHFWNCGRRNLLITFFFTFSLVICIAILMSQSVGAIAMLAVFLAIILSSAVVKISVVYRVEWWRIILHLSALAFAFVFVSVAIVHSSVLGERTKSRLNEFISSASMSQAYEKLSSDRDFFKSVTLDMILTGGYGGGGESAKSADFMKIFYGAGAESYPNISRIYLSGEKKFSTYAYSSTFHKTDASVLLNAAHSDFLQITFEYGILWGGILCILCGFWLYKILHKKFWRSGFAYSLSVGVIIIFLYSFNDIILYNNFIVVNIIVLAILSTNRLYLSTDKSASLCDS